MWYSICSKNIKFINMNIPHDFIEGLEQSLPDVSTFQGSHYDLPFVYEGYHYHITFYKVSRNNGYSFFWLCNPYRVEQRIVNGSRKATENH